jgi:peptidoglycan/xylan/chitin deacetylase (PgdA/CDA1 family)
VSDTTAAEHLQIETARRTDRDVLYRALARKLELMARLSSNRAGLILLYHRVGDPQGDPSRELVPSLGSAHLRSQLRHLRKRYRVVRASAILQAVRSRRRGERFPVAVTFDDDYETHCSVAAALLQEQGMTATFFLTGASLVRPTRFWWENLEALVDDGTMEHEHFAEASPRELDEALRREPGALQKLATRVERMEPSRKQALSERLENLRTTPAPHAMGSPDVRALADKGFEIGFHTRQHDFLPVLNESDLQDRLVERREELAAAAGRPMELLAYPHGPGDQRVAEAARRLGYGAAYTVQAAAVVPTTNAHLLPRWEPPFRSDGIFQLKLAKTLLLGTHP